MERAHIDTATRAFIMAETEAVRQKRRIRRATATATATSSRPMLRFLLFLLVPLLAVVLPRNSCLCSAWPCAVQRRSVKTRGLFERPWSSSSSIISRTLSTRIAVVSSDVDNGNGSERSTSSSDIESGSSSKQQQQQLQPPASSALLVQQNFYRDMQRVLESRRCALQELQLHQRSQGRRRKPVVLTSDVDGALKAYSMLQHLRQIGAASEAPYVLVMRAFLQRGRLRWQQPAANGESSNNNMPTKNMPTNNSPSIICAADQLELLLHELQALTQSLDKQPPLSMDTYNLVLQAYATCSTPRGDRDYASKAQQLLERMQDQCSRNGGTTNSTITVPVESLMHVLHAYAWQQANLQEGICAAAAHDLLQQICQQTNDLAILLPSHDWVLEAWSKSGSAHSATRADAVFAQLKALNATLTGVLLAKERDGHDGSSNISSSSSATRSDERLDDDHATAASVFDAETYSNAILAWSKCSELGSAARAHELLLEMLEKYQTGAFPAGSEPTLIAFNGVITAWGKAGRVEKAEQVLWLMEEYRPLCRELVPDAVSFNSVLHAYMKSGAAPGSGGAAAAAAGAAAADNRKQSLDNALALVQYMEDNHHLQPAIKPNTFTYNTLLKCWIQSGRSDMAENAERVLHQMEQLWRDGDTAVQPNNRIFNMVINAYSKSDQYFATRKAFELLNRMKASRQCRPDIVSYTSVMECLSKSADPKAVQQAEDLLDEAFMLYNKTGNPALMPNLRTFSMVILTLAKNNGSAVKARALLTQLVGLYETTKNPLLLPNEYPYNYVLNCAANALENKQEAFQIATQTYQEMRQSEIVKPDSFTYGTCVPSSALCTKNDPQPYLYCPNLRTSFLSSLSQPFG